MKRTATGLGIAAAVACAVTLGAQTSTTTAQRTSGTDKAKDVTVTGCLARDTAGSGFILNDAKMDNGASSTTTTAGTTTAGTTGATTSGTNASAMSSGPAMNWTLSGGNDLDKHVGHKIQVTGKTTWDSSMNHTSAAAPAPDPTTTAGGATAGTTGTREGAHGTQPRLDVESIKMISTSCS